MSTAIKEYWDQRALLAAESPSATTDDVHLRGLEIRTLTEVIQGFGPPTDSVVIDVGCGDGFSTLRIAERFPDLRFMGVDYSEAMIATARSRLAEATGHLGKRVEFRVGDAATVGGLFPCGSAEVVMTDRCLINLPSANAQYEAIREIHSLLRVGGRYLAIENFTSGQDELNRLRAAIGLREIPVRWHNLYFREDEFLAKTQALFKQVEIVDFSSAYYYATRVIYSKYCQIRGEEPNYQHEIHQLAVQLPPIGAFSPIKLAILTR